MSALNKRCESDYFSTRESQRRVLNTIRSYRYISASMCDIFGEYRVEIHVEKISKARVFRHLLFIESQYEVRGKNMPAEPSYSNFDFLQQRTSVTTLDFSYSIAPQNKKPLQTSRRGFGNGELGL